MSLLLLPGSWLRQRLGCFVEGGDFFHAALGNVKLVLLAGMLLGSFG